MKTISSFLFLLIAALPSFCQESPKAKTAGIFDLYFSAGISTSHSRHATLDQFRNLLPGSEMLKSDLSNFSEANHMPYASALVNCSMALGISFRDPRFQLRVGATYQAGNGINGNLSHTEPGTVDTLTSPVTGNQVFVESQTGNEYYMRWYADQVMVDAALILKSKGPGRFYSGAGLSAGVSVKSQSSITYVTTNSRQYSSDTDNLYAWSYGEYNVELEYYRYKPAYNFSAWLPFGAEMRLGKEDSNLHLFTELKLGLNYLSISDLQSFCYVYGQGNAGLRVSLK